MMDDRIRGFIDNAGVLVTGAVTALLWANSDFESYDQFARLLRFAVNNLGMVAIAPAFLLRVGRFAPRVTNR